MELRDYQREAVDASFEFLRRGGRSGLIVAPTGSGKSAILAAQVEQIVGGWDARCLVATHRSELIRQDEAAIVRYWPEGRDRVGVYSAGLGRRELRACTVAGVQSISRRVAQLGHVDVVLIDEAHLVSPKSDTQYGRLLAGLRDRNPDLVVLGLTATPYRLGQGLLTQGKDAIFKSVCYSIDVKRLIREGYLSPLVSSKTSTKIELDGVSISGGEFVLSDLELAADVDSITEAVARDIAESRRRHVLVFGVSVGHAARLRNAIRMQGISCETVVGETPNRGKILDSFKRGEIQCITSCDVLTTGFDSPNVNLIAVVRATMSPSLWVQICGRGMRLADGKSDCVVLDYGGNIARHGPIDDVRVTAKASNGNGKAPMKICPSCLAEVPANARTCEHCDHEFPAPERKANERASTLAVISGEKAEPVRYVVERVEYARHEKDGKTPSMRVSYYGPESKSAWHPIASEWICLEHSGFARLRAESWWRQHHDGAAECPISVDAALELRDYFRPIRAIFTMPDGKYTRISGCEFAPSRDVGADEDEDEVEVEDEDEGNVGDPWDGDELPW